MADEKERRRDELEREMRDRTFDLLKHVSTLNVAALVLILALLGDFTPKGILPGVEELPLVCFGVSLIFSMFGLFFAPLGWLSEGIVFLATLLSFATFMVGMFLTVLIGAAAL